ncbi:hypothetical protein [Ralstonia pseudosolanacearum]|uniref:hypothetical protein n=1 Tax=Ralstonia pseudosolanacearum TaxID=1310165 RepID=UPI003CE87EE7
MSDIHERAASLYTPPFRFLDGSVVDANNSVVANAHDTAHLQGSAGTLVAEILTKNWPGYAPNAVEVIDAELVTAKASHDGRAIDVLIEAFDCTLREHGFTIVAHPAAAAAPGLSDAEKEAIKVSAFQLGWHESPEVRRHIPTLERLLTRAGAATVAEPSDAGLYTLDQMRDYAEAFHKARIEKRLSACANETLHAQNVGYSDGYLAGNQAAQQQQDQSKVVLANLVNAVRWWGAQEDGIPAEVASAFNAAHLALGWSLSHPMDFNAAHQEAIPKPVNIDESAAEIAAAREWIVEHRPALTLSRKATVDAYMCVLKVFDALAAAHQQSEPRADEKLPLDEWYRIAQEDRSAWPARNVRQLIDRIRTLEASGVAEDARDAVRWRTALRFVGAYSSGGWHFDTLPIPAGVNLMQGSVAQHFEAAIDVATASAPTLQEEN